MSDTHVEEDEEQEQPDEGGLAQLRKSARQGEQARQENAVLRKELLFAKVGIDTDTKIGKMLFQTWAGDDADELKTEATSLGLIGADPALLTKTDAEIAREAEDQQRQQMYDAQQGGQPSGSQAPETENPRDKAMKTYQVNVKNGMDPEMARTDAFAQVLAAGRAGDKRVLFDAEAHAAAALEADRLAARPRQ